jgi:hypothetical protein
MSHLIRLVLGGALRLSAACHQRMPGLNVVRVQDVGLAETPDSAILAWAAGEERILLTHDYDTVPGFAYERVRSGESMPGVFLVSDQMPKGQAIDELLLAIECYVPGDCKDLIQHFPL